MAPSVGSLCHPRFTTTNLSYGFPIVKLPPPPCAVLLASTRKCRVGCHPQRCWRVSLVQSTMGNQLIRTAVSIRVPGRETLQRFVLAFKDSQGPRCDYSGSVLGGFVDGFIARNTWIDWLCYIQWDIVLFPRAFERMVLQKRSCYLTSSDRTSAHLISSHLTSAHLTSSPLTSAHLMSSHLTSAHLTSSHLKSASLTLSYIFTSHVCSSYIFTSYVCSPYIFTSHVCSSYIFTSYVCSSYIFTSYVCSSYIFTSYVCSSYVFTSYVVSSLFFLCPLLFVTD